MSSTFEDFAAERDALQQGVCSDNGELLVESPFRRLRDRCIAEGADLEVIDLRWGISATVSQSYATMHRCLAEVRRARAAPSPNFLALVGDRYGWRPVPAVLPEARFAAMLATAPASDARLLRSWYRPETNVIPSTRVLRSDRGLLASEAERRLHRVVREAWTASGAPLDEGFASATEQEILLALENRGPGARGAALCFHRRIVDLPGDGVARHFRDQLSDGRPDEEANGALAELVERLRQDPRVAYREHEVTWRPGGPGADATYLARFVEGVHAELDWRIGKTLEELDRSAPSAEREAHDTFAESRRRFFIGRRVERARVTAYLEQPATGPLLVSGPGGSGKSALLAWTVAEAERLGHRAQARFIGTSAAASAGEQLAASLVAEGTGAAPLSDPVDALGAMLSKQPQVTTTVVVDGLDLLPERDELARFRWVPERWPRMLRVLVATRSEDDVTRLLRIRPNTITLGLGPLTTDEARQLFTAVLTATHRDVSSTQQAMVAAALAEAVTTPLYVRMLAAAASTWSVVDQVTPPARDLDGIIRQLFDELSAPDRHGAVLVTAVCRLLTASRLGLASAELLDALSADRSVMDDFRDRHRDSPQVGELPAIIWSALRGDLDPYLGTRSSEGLTLIDFFHADLRLAAGARYLDGPERARTHQRLAELFTRRGTSGTGRWRPGARRPSTETGHHRLAAGDDRAFDALVRDGSFLLAAAGQRRFQAGRTPPAVNPTTELTAQLRQRATGDPAAARAVQALVASRELLAVHPQHAAQVLADDGFPVTGLPDLAGVRTRRVDHAPRPSREHGSTVTAIAVSADGTHVASGDMEGRVGWRTMAMGLEWCENGHAGWVTAVAVSPDGATVASGGHDGAILLWDTTTTQAEPVQLPAGTRWGQVTALSFADDSRLLVLRLGQALAVDLQTGDIEQLANVADFTWSLGWHDPDRIVLAGSRLVACSDNDGNRTAWVAVVDVLDADTPRMQCTTAYGTGGVGLDRRHVLLSSADGFRLFDLARPQEPPRQAPGPVCDSISSHRRLGFIGLQRGTAEIVRVGEDLNWKVSGRLSRYRGGRGSPRLLRSSPGSDLVAVSWSSGAITVVDPDTGHEVHASAWSPRVFAGAIDPTGRSGGGLVTSGALDRSMKVTLASAGGAPVVTTPRHTDQIIALTTSTSGQLLSLDRTGRVIVHPDDETEPLEVGTEVASAAEWRDADGVAVGTTDGRVLLVGSEPDEVVLGHPADGWGRVNITSLDAAGTPPAVAATHLNGLTAWGPKHDIQWRPQDRGDTYPPTAVRLLPGERVADGNLHGRVRVWDRRSVEPVLTWAAHVGAVQSLQAIGEHLLLSAGVSGSVFVVDLRDATVVGGVMVVGGLAAARVIGDELVVLRRDGWLIRYRLEGMST